VPTPKLSSFLSTRRFLFERSAGVSSGTYGTNYRASVFITRPLTPPCSTSRSTPPHTDPSENFEGCFYRGDHSRPLVVSASEEPPDRSPPVSSLSFSPASPHSPRAQPPSKGFLAALPPASTLDPQSLQIRPSRRRRYLAAGFSFLSRAASSVGLRELMAF